MACDECSPGIWQCSTDPDPCGMTYAAQPIDTQDHCFNVYTKSAAGKCMMKIVMDNDHLSGWDDAGEICFKFELFKDAATGACFVKVT